jgi:3-phenylpropionate/trans-cinnamate dioxygenase ferredoxin component
MKDSPSFDFILIGPLDEIKPGGRTVVDFGDLSIIVFNVSNTLYAIGNLCPHDLGELGEGDIEGFEISCPRHGARFDIRNGKVLRLPATQDIPSYPVRIVEGNIEVGIPLE